MEKFGSGIRDKHTRSAKLVGSTTVTVLLSPYRYSILMFYNMVTCAISNTAKRLMQAEEMRGVLCVSLDPGTVDTKMLRTGWEGCCGIPLQQADDTFWIATSPVRYAERLER